MDGLSVVFAGLVVCEVGEADVVVADPKPEPSGVVGILLHIK